MIVTRHGKGSFVAEVNGLAGELREAELDDHLGAAAAIARGLGMTDEEVATRLRRIQRELEKKK